MTLINIESELEAYRSKLKKLNTLNEKINELTKRDQSFALSLIGDFLGTRGLSPKQWEWVSNLHARLEEAEPLYGDFDAILVMFRLAGEHLKRPKIRLITEENEYVMLSFNVEKQEVDIYTGGWAHHGRRRFVGWVKEDKLVPYTIDRLTPSIKLTLQEFSLNPQQVAQTMAQRIGGCMYCGQALTDPESKTRGYGPVCAEHFHLPWGKYTNEPLPSLEELFN